MTKLKFIFLSLITLLLSTSISTAQNDFKETALTPKVKDAAISRQIMTSGFADIVEDLLPSVVNISTSQEINAVNEDNISGIFDLPNGSIFNGLKELLDGAQKKEVASLGSGFIISKDGYIVSNYHVIEGADEIIVNLSDTRKYKAKLIGIDKKTDLALLKINPDGDLKYVQFGDSNKSRIGEWVIAVGNPFGLGGSVSVGIVSARGRDINSGQSDGFIQTDAAINKGNSGGPLFNIKGEVIGVATAILSPSGSNIGIGFATPSSTAISVIKQLKEKGEVVRGWIGVSVQDVSSEMAETIGMDKSKGAFVIEVIKDGPAYKAGIIPTDIIIKFDDQEIANMKELPKIVSKTPIGKKTKIVVLRQGKTKNLNVEVKKLQDEDFSKDKNKMVNKNVPGKATSYLLGMGLTELDKKAAESSGGNIIIANIKPKTNAFKKCIEVGDIILSANQMPVKSIADLKKIIEASKKSKHDGIFLFLKREDLVKNNNIIKSESTTFAVVLPIE